MPATPDAIARYTQDGITLTYKDAVLKAAEPTATDGGEIPTFFRYRADAQVCLDQRAALLGGDGKAHEAVEVEETLGIGTAIPVTPVVPSFRLVDESRGLDFNGRTRSVSFDMTIDRYSIEVVQ